MTIEFYSREGKPVATLTVHEDFEMASVDMSEEEMERIEQLLPGEETSLEYGWKAVRTE